MSHKTARPVPARQMAAVRLLRLAAEGWGCISAITDNTDTSTNLIYGTMRTARLVEGIAMTTQEALAASVSVYTADLDTMEKRIGLERAVMAAVEQSEALEALERLSELADLLAPEPTSYEREEWNRADAQFMSGNDRSALERPETVVEAIGLLTLDQMFDDDIVTS